MISSSTPWVVVSAWARSTTGQGKPIVSLIEALSRRGTPVELVAFDVEPAVAALPLVTIHRSPRIRGADVVGNLFLRRRGRAVAAAVTQRHPEAVVVVNGGNCRWADVNWVHYVHAAFTPPAIDSAPLVDRVKERVVGGMYRRQERAAINVARLVVANSELTRRDVIQRLGTRPQQVRTIYYGLDAKFSPPSDAERDAARERFHIAADRPTAVFVGGFGHDGRKGFDTLLDAWSQLSHEPSFRGQLLMAGGGRAIDAVRRRIQEQQLERSVQLLGFVDDVAELLAAVDLLVSPVRYEPYGMNVQEALGRGLPALVSAQAGIAERYPAELHDFVLSKADNVAELAVKLKAWHDDPVGARTRFVSFGEEIRRRSWNDMAQEFIAAVEASRT